MPERSGWITLHRSMLDHPLMEQLPAAWLRIWVVILLTANWRPGVWWDGKEEISIPAGSFVISLDKLASKSGSGVQQVRTALKYFETTRMITRDATHSYTTITIVNWATYQEHRQLDNTTGNTLDSTAVTERQHSGNTAVTTIEQLNNNNNMSKSNDLDPGPRVVRKSKPEIGSEIRDWFHSEFWPAYPRHEAKATALLAASKKATTPERRAFYLERLKAQLPEYTRRKAESGQHVIPLAATWFHQDRADDDLEPISRRADVTNDYPEYELLEAR